MTEEAPASLSPTLRLAWRWARRLGNEVGTIDGVDPQGRHVVALQAKHGSVIVVVVDRDDGLVEVSCPQDILPSVATRAAALPEQTKLKAWITFRQQLLSHPRSGFVFDPPTATGVHLLRRWAVVQFVLLEDGNPSTFNRFADAIQEVVTVFIAGASVIGAAVRDPTQGQLGGSSGAPPDGIYR